MGCGCCIIRLDRRRDDSDSNDADRVRDLLMQATVDAGYRGRRLPWTLARHAMDSVDMSSARYLSSRRPGRGGSHSLSTPRIRTRARRHRDRAGGDCRCALRGGLGHRAGRPGPRLTVKWPAAVLRDFGPMLLRDHGICPSHYLAPATGAAAAPAPILAASSPMSKLYVGRCTALLIPASAASLAAACRSPARRTQWLGRSRGHGHDHSREAVK
jgi:hypothetical protein